VLRRAQGGAVCVEPGGWRVRLSFFRQEDLIENPARLCEAALSVHGLRAIGRNRTVPAQCGARSVVSGRECAALSQA